VGKLRENWLTVVMVVALLITYLALRTPTSGLSEQAVWAEVENADVSVLYFYSNT